MDLISIVIPIYNVEKYIEKCIKSVLNLTYKNIEIILVNDGSTDTSGKICESYSEKIDFVHVIHQENKGVSVARKVGLKESRGRYIIFIDSDDWIEKDYVEELYNAIIDTQADMVACGYYEDYDGFSKTIGDSNGNMKTYSNIDAIKAVNERKDIYSFMWNKIFCREALNELNDSIPIIIGEDYTIVVKCIYKMKKITTISTPLYHYIQRNSGVCNRGFDKKMFDVVENYKNVYIFFRDNGESKLLDSFKCYSLLEEMYYVICMSKNNKYDKRFIRIVTEDTREYLIKYLLNKNVSLGLKCCAIANAINYRLLILGYKLVNHGGKYYS